MSSEYTIYDGSGSKAPRPGNGSSKKKRRSSISTRFKKAVKKKLVKKLKSRRTISEGRDSDAARSRSAGKSHTSRASGTSHRQAVGGYAPREKRSYERKDPRIVAALQQIRRSNRCQDRTAAITCVRRHLARKQADKYVITSDGIEYLRSGRGFD